jgi:hypothetical protein
MPGSLDNAVFSAEALRYSGYLCEGGVSVCRCDDVGAGSKCKGAVRDTACATPRPVFKTSEKY